ncbi:MAG: prolyl aminopeptidase, partial [Brevundimonas sp.]|nr:prolyl aminopeptidase [Brevundimonas sp.]
MAFPVTETPRRELYPELEPFASGWMKTDSVHEIYFEECGNPQGQPVLVLHGGPGGAVNPAMRRYFDPSIYR